MTREVGVPSGVADEQPHAKRGGQRITTTAAATTTAPPSPLPSLNRPSHRCAVIAIAALPLSLPSALPPFLPSLCPIAAPPLLRCHHNRCAATTSAVIPRPQQAHRSPERSSTVPPYRLVFRLKINSLGICRLPLAGKDGRWQRLVQTGETRVENQR